MPDGLTSISESAFKDCRSLTSVIIPASVTSIGQSVFSGCSGLTSVTIPTGLTSISESAFSDCWGMSSVTIPAGVTAYYAQKKDASTILLKEIAGGYIPANTGVILKATGLIVVGLIVIIGVVFFGVRSKRRYEED